MGGNLTTTLKEKAKPQLRRIVPDRTTGMAASQPLTDAELKLVTVNFDRKKPLQISQASQIRGEMIRIYDMVTSGQLPLNCAMKLVYILRAISLSKLDEEKLEILRKGGIGGAPFVGVILEGPKE